MREAVLDAAETMVQDRGLNAVSFQQLAEAVGLSKATVFHHFPTKEALARALVDRCRTKYADEYGAIIDGDGTAPEKLHGIAAVFAKGLRRDRLCLLGSLGQTVATLPASVQDELRSTADGTIRRYALVFEQGRAEGTLSFEGKPADAAAAFLAMLEGLQVLARARREPALFRRGAAAFIDSLCA